MHAHIRLHFRPPVCVRVCPITSVALNLLAVVELFASLGWLVLLVVVLKFETDTNAHTLVVDQSEID